MQAKLTLTITLHYDPLWHETPEERAWFIATIVNNARLISHLHPEPIGTITVHAPVPSQGIKSPKA